jgi:hypothetical protein
MLMKSILKVHFSLRRQLHLLPHIRHLKSREQQFYFFGARLERSCSPGEIETHPVRFWNFGTLIMLTPKFVLENEIAMNHVLNYQVCFLYSLDSQLSHLIEMRIKLTEEYVANQGCKYDPLFFKGNACSSRGQGFGETVQ